MSTNPESLSRPRLRPLEPIPFDHEGEQRVAWRDPMGIANMVEVPMSVAVLMSLFDGDRELPAVQADWLVGSGGEELPLEFLEQFARDLDEHLLLDSPRFAAALDQIRHDFAAAGIRPVSHAPGAYPADPTECAAFFDQMLAAGAAASPSAASGPVRGLVAPHIDFRRGGLCYGAAYETLRDSTADLFIVVGIAHSTTIHPLPQPLLTVTRLDYATPLGTVTTDQAFLDRFTAGYEAAGGDSADLFRDELVHRSEHSVEFQMALLQHLHGHRPFTAVPLLGGSLHDFYSAPELVAEEPGLGCYLAGLRAAIAGHDGEVCLIAGADLAHIGPRFGAAAEVDEDDLARIEAADAEALRRWCDEGADSFFAHFAADDNQRNVCSVSNLYLLRALLPEASAELLRWEAAFDPEQTVSFAAAALR